MAIKQVCSTECLLHGRRGSSTCRVDVLLTILLLRWSSSFSVAAARALRFLSCESRRMKPDLDGVVTDCCCCSELVCVWKPRRDVTSALSNVTTGVVCSRLNGLSFFTISISTQSTDRSSFAPSSAHVVVATVTTQCTSA